MLEPTHFPIDIDVDSGDFLFASVAAERIADAPFLDARLGVDPATAQRVHWRALPTASRRPSASLLFHTAFCCSTLLARTLQAPPRVVALKEPACLSRLAGAALHAPPRQLDVPLARALDLLARPWMDGGRCVIKPTNQANNLLPDMLRLCDGRALLLHSSLQDFVISCLKKLPAGERPLRWMAQQLIKDTRLQQRLGVPWDHPFHVVEACVLTWYAQIERYADALAADHGDRLRSLDMQSLLADPLATVTACAKWLQLDLDATTLAERVQVEFQRDAKHPERAYDAGRRADESRRIATEHAGLLDAVIGWAREVIAPLARVPLDWKSLEVAPLRRPQAVLRPPTAVRAT